MRKIRWKTRCQSLMPANRIGPLRPVRTTDVILCWNKFNIFCFSRIFLFIFYLYFLCQKEEKTHLRLYLRLRKNGEKNLQSGSGQTGQTSLVSIFIPTRKFTFKRIGHICPTEFLKKSDTQFKWFKFNHCVNSYTSIRL